MKRLQIRIYLSASFNLRAEKLVWSSLLRCSFMMRGEIRYVSGQNMFVLYRWKGTTTFRTRAIYGKTKSMCLNTWFKLNSLHEKNRWMYQITVNKTPGKWPPTSSHEKSFHVLLLLQKFRSCIMICTCKT